MRNSECGVLYAALLLGIVFLLRIFYAAYVWADEGLWFTAAQELLSGKALYSEVWFDKPPAVAWIYAALFAVAGPGVLAVRLFTILYATAVALALCHIGTRLWGRSEGRLAALLYAIYNATYIHSQVQPMAVDQLMLLPYLYSGYFFLQGRAFWSGLLAAAAFSINPKAAVLFLFFLFRTPHSALRTPQLFVGFAAGCLPWLLYLLSADKWSFYLQEFWGWGFRYVSVYSPWAALLNGARRTLNYAGFHAALILGAAVLLLSYRRTKAPGDSPIWLWLCASFFGVAAGGRFFPRYFYQVLPLLCLLAARGYLQLLPTADRRLPTAFRLPPSASRLVFWLCIAFSLARFHARGAVLAYEWITGRQTAYMAAWDDPAIDRDSRLVARRLREGASLFVWGYRPEIYFYCGCRPASMFLSSQPLTGVPADVHLRDARSAAPERAAENRRRLLRELVRTEPQFIVDGLGPYNPALAMVTYPELRAFLERHYEFVELAGNAAVYARRDTPVLATFRRKNVAATFRSPPAAPHVVPP